MEYYENGLSDSQPVASATQMARITFFGEQEFRTKIAVEISHHLVAELRHLDGLLKKAGAEGGAWFSYNHPLWTPWILSGPELSEGTNDTLARRKTTMREYLILESLKQHLDREGYTCNITRPYHGVEDKRPFLYIQWNNPKPSLSRVSCWKNLIVLAKFLFLAWIVMSFLVAFTALCIFTGWLMYTRWEKLDLW